MNKLEQKFLNNLKKETSILENKNIILGISGGSDSIALLTLFKNVINLKKCNIKIVHVDFQLREDSKEESALIKNYVEQMKNEGLDVDFFEKQWEISNQPKNSIEEAARDFRYNFFKEISQKFNNANIVLAHHADDQVETIIFKLMRGGDWRQLKGIEFERNLDKSGIKISRPLLSFSKEDLKEYNVSNNNQWIEDSTNQDSDYAKRNLIRNEIIPLLNKLNPNFQKNILSFSQQLDNLDRDLTGEIIKTFLIENNNHISFKENQISQFIKLLNNPNKKEGIVELENGFVLSKNNKKITIKNNISNFEQ